MIEFTQISKLMASKGFPVTADRCASKMKSMRERFHEINEKAKEGGGRRSHWPFYAKMNELLGFDDTVTLQYVHEVGAREKPKRPGDDSPPFETPKKLKTRVNRSESLNRLADMEAERKARDEQFFQTWKVHNESAAAKNTAIISAAAAMEQVSLALLKKLQTTNSQVKILIIHRTIYKEQ